MTYAFGEKLGVSLLKILDLGHDLLFECDVAVINVLRKVLHGVVHGLLSAEDGASGVHVLIGMLVESC